MRSHFSFNAFLSFPTNRPFSMIGTQISRDEWYSMWEEYAKDPEHAVEWQQTYMNLVFDLEDISGELTAILRRLALADIIAFNSVITAAKRGVSLSLSLSLSLSNKRLLRVGAYYGLKVTRSMQIIA
jgi:ACT domain-containing protein